MNVYLQNPSTQTPSEAPNSDMLLDPLILGIPSDGDPWPTELPLKATYLFTEGAEGTYAAFWYREVTCSVFSS